jgi:hypothetical protein
MNLRIWKHTRKSQHLDPLCGFVKDPFEIPLPKPAPKLNCAIEMIGSNLLTSDNIIQDVGNLSQSRVQPPNDENLNPTPKRIKHIKSDSHNTIDRFLVFSPNLTPGSSKSVGTPNKRGPKIEHFTPCRQKNQTTERTAQITNYFSPLAIKK